MTCWYRFNITGLIQVEDPETGVTLIRDSFSDHGRIVRCLRVDCGGVVEVGYEEKEEYEGNEK